MRYIAPALAVFIFCTSVTAAISVTYNVNTDVNRTPISKYIYGVNQYGTTYADTTYTVVRNGGNNTTPYNWENNCTNAGADYGPYDNYAFTSLTPAGKYITDFRNDCIANNEATVVTLPMTGYVAADSSGNVTLPAQTAPSSRFKSAVFAKGAPFCSPPGSPNTTDANVYVDEFINFLVSTYGYAGASNGVKFYDLDNEPDLWSQTHPEVHPAKAGCAEYKNKSVALCTAVKNVDPNAQMLGPVSYGFNGYLSFQSAPDWSSVKGSYSWFLDYYLDQMRQAGITAGKRLLDVLDLHWYPEAQDPSGNRIINNVSTTAMYDARMQAPRSLWDPDYKEKSWIETSYPSYLPILPRIKSSINTYYPDTNISTTEYQYGGESHWSGGIATADVLGIFGKYGVYLATYWGASTTYTKSAIKIYTNYDGSGSKFGDTEVYSTMSDKANSSIYASEFSGYTCELHLIAINKNQSNAISGTFNITSPQNFYSGRVWKFDNNSSTISETTAISSITGNSFTYTIPATTVCHMVLKANPPEWDTTGPSGVSDCHVNIWDLKDFAASWLIPYDLNDLADFAQEWGM